MKENIAIITSYIRGSEEKITALLGKVYDESGLIIVADGGLDHIRSRNLACDIIVGDFDSVSQKPSQEEFPEAEIIEVPVRKDFTDLHLALETALKYQPEEIRVVGGFGGQTDHTIGNIQNLCWAYESCKRIMMIDPVETLIIQGPGRKTYPEIAPGVRFSLMAIGGDIKGLTIKGASYQVDRVDIDKFFPLGCGNSGLGRKVTVELEAGMLAFISPTSTL